MVDQNLPPLAPFNNGSSQVSEAFSQKKEEGGSDFSSLANLISDLDRRLRTLEERYSNLRKKIQLSDQSVIENERTFLKEIRGVNEEVLELKRTMNDFSEKILAFGAEMQGTAKKQDVKVIEKYLLFWSPQNFVTRNELREYLRANKVRLIHPRADDEDPGSTA